MLASFPNMAVATEFAMKISWNLRWHVLKICLPIVKSSPRSHV